MQVIDIIPSRERCEEAGWHAWDVYLDRALDDEIITALRPLGSWLYLSTLKKPFFKIESDYYFLKGLKGDTFFRMGVHGDHEEELQKLKAFIENIP